MLIIIDVDELEKAQHLLAATTADAEDAFLRLRALGTEMQDVDELMILPQYLPMMTLLSQSTDRLRTCFEQLQALALATENCAEEFADLEAEIKRKVWASSSQKGL